MSIILSDSTRLLLISALPAQDHEHLKHLIETLRSAEYVEGYDDDLRATDHQLRQTTGLGQRAHDALSDLTALSNETRAALIAALRETRVASMEELRARFEGLTWLELEASAEVLRLSTKVQLPAGIDPLNTSRLTSAELAMLPPFRRVPESTQVLVVNIIERTSIEARREFIQFLDEQLEKRKQEADIKQAEKTKRLAELALRIAYGVIGKLVSEDAIPVVNEYFDETVKFALEDTAEIIEEHLRSNF